MKTISLAATAVILASCSLGEPNSAGSRTDGPFDVIIRGGTVYDGSGGVPFQADVGLHGDRIGAIGDLAASDASVEIDATGLVVAPGFINMLSWATESLLVDGRSQSDIRQGVTLEIFGEGTSMGPLNASMKERMVTDQGDLKFEVPWTTLGEYLEHLEERGVSCNVASFIGATTVRVHELGYEDRAPSVDELARMKGLVRRAMEEGAMGIGSSLIYTPAAFADTNELVELCRVASEYGGLYISHIRSEGDRLIEAVDELITIARAADIPAEVYHLKAAGRSNWDKLDQVIDRIEHARAAGLKITADMYTYIAGATGLDAAMPPWVQEGGFDKWSDNLQNPETRAEVIEAMKAPGEDWENLYYAAGSADNLILVGFKNPDLKGLTGKTLAEVAIMRNKSPEETAIDLVVEDGSRVGTVYFLMSEENVRKQLALPWVSFCSDAGSLFPEGEFLKSNPHPRAYGNFARVVGKYVRDEGVLQMADAIRRLTALPAENLKLTDRGRIATGFFADLAIFDPAKIQDHATFAEPHQLSTGMVHVFVNGAQVLRDGNHIGATPGRFVRGPGYVGR